MLIKEMKAIEEFLDIYGDSVGVLLKATFKRARLAREGGIKQDISFNELERLLKERREGLYER
jgi:hypothetical protein